jgi:hypothetical protein
MELCPLNLDAAEKSPFYVFAWQHAAAMSTEEENGSVYVFDVAGLNLDKSKFMITCPKGQDI